VRRRPTRPLDGSNSMRFSLAMVVIGCALLAACFSQARYAPGTHYFQRANLYLDPPIPTDEISPERASELASAGQPYYEADYDASGRLTRFQHHRSSTVSAPPRALPDGGAAVQP